MSLVYHHSSELDLAVGGAAIGLADGVGDTLRSHFRRVLATRRYLAMFAGPECFRPAVSADRDLAAVNHVKALATQVAFKRFARNRPAVATASGNKGYAFGAYVLGVHAVGGHLTALPGAERFR